MKIIRAVIGLLLMFLSVSPLVVATPTPPLIRLPTDLVTINAVYGNSSYFTMTLTDVPLGFDLTDGIYPGWCVEKTILMTQNVNHTVLLYSSYDASLPLEYQTKNWNKINYIINHKQGNKTSVQKAIWHYTNNEDCSSDPDATSMITAAEQFGTTFIPAPGELIAIPVQGVPVIQLTFIELRIPLPQVLEGLIWYDTNRNGLQDNGEPGMNNITVRLFQNTSLLFKNTTTDTKGSYCFPEIITGFYYLQVLTPTGYLFSPMDVGTNDALDSDVDATGKTPVFIITINTSNLRWDAGLYSATEPSRQRNHRPTADGTAGEPYNGFVYQPITFDGTRSYDRDGWIISWQWTFGDGITNQGETSTHGYQQPGYYPVTLTVTDNWHTTDVYTTTAHIRKANNPPSQPIVTGPIFGHVNIPYYYTIVSSDPDNNPLQLDIDWGDDYQDSLQFIASGHQITTVHTWTAYGFYILTVSAQDRHQAYSQPFEMTIAIDVVYIGTLGYLIDLDSDGIFDVFYSNATTRETKAHVLDNGEYLIDTNEDQTLDIVYSPATQEYHPYYPTPIIEYIVLTTLVILFLLLFFLQRIKGKTRILRSKRRTNK